MKTPSLSCSNRPEPGGPVLNRQSSVVNRRSIAILAAAVLIGPAHVSFAGSLWKQETSRSMFSDKRAHMVGDILTILVQESNSTTKEKNTKTAKKSGIDASINTFLYSPAASGLMTKGGKLPALNVTGANNFEGSGQINNSEKISDRIAVRVADVMPNGQLLLEGRRLTSFSNEKQEVVLRGMVRQEDISANNTIFSYNIADATIQFESKGAISDSTKKGWFTRVWDKVSPF